MAPLRLGSSLAPGNAHYHAYGLAAENQIAADACRNPPETTLSQAQLSENESRLRKIAESECSNAVRINPRDPLFANNLAWIKAADDFSVARIKPRLSCAVVVP
jgi:hypothetical protein